MTRRLLVGLLLLVAVCGQAQSVRPILCDRNTLFVLNAQGFPWPTLEPPQRYVVELRDRDALVAKAEGLHAPLEPFLTAAFPSPFPIGAALRVTVLGAGGVKVGEAPLSTQPKATIQLSRAAAEAHYRLEAYSSTPLVEIAAGSELLLVEVRREQLDGVDGSQIPEETIEHRVDVFRQPFTGCGSFREEGSSVVVDLRPDDRLRDGSVGLRLVGLTDIFGQAVVATGDIVPAKAPKGKDDAALFVKALFEKAAGSGDAYSLDFKVRPRLSMRGRWLFRPEAAAYFAKDVPGATSSIRLSALFSHTSVRQERLLMAQTFSLGPAVHADRDFERVNALLDLRWQPDFKGQYRSRETRRFAVAAQRGRRPDELALPAFGFGFDAYFGLEAGRTVRSETPEDEDRDVLRLRPHLHGFIELGRLTLDVSSSLRYLVVEEAGVDGFRPYTEATLSLAFDPAKHLALALTYKNGSEPPLFVKVDKYSAGIVAKY